MSAPTSIRLSDRTRAQLRGLGGTSTTATVARAVDLLWRSEGIGAAAPALVDACRAALYCPALNTEGLEPIDITAIDKLRSALTTAIGGDV